MESIAKVHCSHQPLHLSLNPHRPSFPKPITSLSFRTPHPPTSSSPFKFSAVKASSSSPPSSSTPIFQTSKTPKPKPKPKPSLIQTLAPVVKTTCITLTAAAALFLTRLHNRPAIAAPAPTATSATAESTKEWMKENVSMEEQEKLIEEHLSQNPDDTEALKSLMEVRIKSRKILEAVEVIDRLIELEPNEDEWPMLKGQLYIYSGDVDSARKLFEEILEKEPLRVEAFHGLVMASSETGDSMKDVLKRIEDAMDKCRKEKKKSDLRDFKLLIAQVRVIEEKYNDALKIYEELVKEEPRDFRPCLCQGIIYTLLRKKDEAEKNFEQFRKLVPKNHPYREYFDDNMFATKLFAGKVENEEAGSRS